MKTETREIYKCEHCRKMYQIKSACETHEKWCSKNPDNKKICNGCEHLCMKKVTYYFDTGYGEDCKDVSALYCDHFEVHLHPLSVERKGNAYEFGNIENIPMKKECKHFKEFLPF